MAGSCGNDAGCRKVYEPPRTLPSYAVHYCELGDIWILAGTADDRECDCALYGEEPAGGDGSSDALDSSRRACACDAGVGAATTGGRVEPGPGERSAADA